MWVEGVRRGGCGVEGVRSGGAEGVSEVRGVGLRE